MVFGTAADAAVSQIGIFEIESRAWRVLVPSGNHPRYIETGHLIYGHGEGALMGVPFDLKTLEVTGTPITLLPRLRVYGGGASQFAVSTSGTMIYALGGPESGYEERFVEVDFDGSERPLPLAPGDLERPRYAPDGSRIAYDESGQIRIYDVVSGANPVFSGEEIASGPAWAASGLDLYFRVGRFGAGYQARRPASGVAPAVSVTNQYRGALLDIAAGDSLGIALWSNGPENPDLRLVRMIGDSLAYEPFLEAEWDEYGADISPDGGWVGYGSSQSGEPRVYVHSFPELSAQYAISSGPATDPVWAPDGSRIYYRDGARFFAVDVSTAPDFTVGTPRLLFEEPTYTMASNLGWVRNWDIHPDGDRFVMVSSPELDGEGRGIGVGLRGLDDVVLVVNWFAEVMQRMGG